MRPSQILRIAFSNLKSNKSRTALTIIGIGIGIAAIVFLVSLGYGLQQLTVQKISSIQAINTLDVMPGRQSITKINASTIQKIKEVSNAQILSPVLMIGAKVQEEDRKTDLVANVVDENFFTLDGTKVNPGVLPSGDAEIIASTGLLKAMGLDSNNALAMNINLEIKTLGLNKEDDPTTKTFKISGIIQDDGSSFAYVPMASIKDKITDSTVYNSLKVKIEDRDKLNQARSDIEGLGFTVNSLADTISQVDSTFRIVRIVLAVFGVIALFVASIGMFNTMTIALLERTRDIGIMKAIGVFNMDIGKIFLVESIIISGLGGIFGTFSGAVVGYFLNFILNVMAKSVGGASQSMFFVPIWLAVGIIVFSILVGIATGLYPSKRAVRLNPLDALRYE